MLLEIYIIFLFLKQDLTFLKNSFFLSTITEWNKLDHNIRSCSSFNIFKKNIQKFIRPSANSLFNCHNSKGIKFITRLRLGLSHLTEHKIKNLFLFETFRRYMSLSVNVHYNLFTIIFLQVFIKLIYQE